MKTKEPEDNGTPLAAYDKAVERAITMLLNPDEHLTGPEIVEFLQHLGQRLLEDSALDLGTMAADGIALTLLSIYNNRTYPGGLVSEPLDKLARILVDSPPRVCDCGEALTVCADCAVADYQAAAGLVTEPKNG